MTFTGVSVWMCESAHITIDFHPNTHKPFDEIYQPNKLWLFVGRSHSTNCHLIKAMIACLSQWARKGGEWGRERWRRLWGEKTVNNISNPIVNHHHHSFKQHREWQMSQTLPFGRVAAAIAADLNVEKNIRLLFLFELMWTILHACAPLHYPEWVCHFQRCPVRPSIVSGKQYENKFILILLLLLLAFFPANWLLFPLWFY